MRFQERKKATNPEHEKRFYELWRLWLLETDQTKWGVGCFDPRKFIKEQKQVISMEFNQWWEKNHARTTDKGYTEYAFVPIKTVENFNEYDGCEDFGEHVFKIGFSTPKHILHEELDKLIAKYHTNHEEGHRSGYFVSDLMEIEWVRNPTKRTVEAVDRIYTVYTKAREMREDAKNSSREAFYSVYKKAKVLRADAHPDSKEVFLYEIGAEAGLRTTWKEEVKKHTAEKVGHSEKELMSTTTRHYLDFAEEIKEGLNKGMFPFFNGR